MLYRRVPLRTLLLTFCCVMLCGTLACADEKEQATVNRLQLLKTYRSEFVPITPGQQQFPQEFDFGPSGKSQTTVVRTKMAENFEIVERARHGSRGKDPRPFLVVRRAVA